MTVLSGFSITEQDLLIRLPYRVGVWISESDDGGGEEADAQEIQVLRALLVAYVQDFCKTEFVQKVMEQTVIQKDQWDGWHDNIDNVIDECRQVMSLLIEHLSTKELSAFRDNLIEIGYSVAMAYCELDDERSLLVKTKAYLSMWVEKIQRSLTGAQEKQSDEYLNISAREQEALNTLVDALSLRQNIDVDPALLDVTVDNGGAHHG